MKTALRFTLSALLGATAFLTMPVLSAQILLSEDFETGQVVGNAPTGASGVANGNGTDTLSRIVTGTDNQAGGGGTGNEGVRLYDNLGTGAVGIEYNFVNSAANQISAFKFELNFALATTSGGTANLVISAGGYSSSGSLALNSSGFRAFEVRINPNGTLDFVSASAGVDQNGNALTAGASNKLTMFVNDYDSQSITYTSPTDSSTVTLAPNSIAYYLNNNAVFTTTLDIESVGSTQWLTTENNFGRVSMITFSNTTGIDATFDNIAVTALVPEPGAGVLCLLSGAGAAFALRRRRRRG